MNGGGIPPKPTTIDITSKFKDAGWISKQFVVSRGSSAHPLGSVMSSSNANSYASRFVDISEFKTLLITMPQLDGATNHPGGCFYNENRVAMNGIDFSELTPVGMFEKEVQVPDGAVYIRTTKRTDSGFTKFKCIGFINED